MKGRYRKQGFAGEEFDEDAAQGPHVSSRAIVELQNHLGCSIKPTLYIFKHFLRLET